jgi:(p)ppGpp synthase/HD superfamily hydrolase
MSQSLLERALAIALEAHRGQVDRQGNAYILHPLRLLARFDDTDLQLIAILHDVVEDSEWTLEALEQAGFPDQIVQAVDALTRRNGESYEALIGRAEKNTLARAVKLADLEDHMDLRRIKNLQVDTLERLPRYQAAWHRLRKTSN